MEPVDGRQGAAGNEGERERKKKLEIIYETKKNPVGLLYQVALQCVLTARYGERKIQVYSGRVWMGMAGRCLDGGYAMPPGLSSFIAKWNNR